MMRGACAMQSQGHADTLHGEYTENKPQLTDPSNRLSLCLHKQQTRCDACAPVLAFAVQKTYRVLSTTITDFMVCESCPPVPYAVSICISVHSIFNMDGHKLSNLCCYSLALLAQGSSQLLGPI